MTPDKASVWSLKIGEQVIGLFSDPQGDQPWILCRFTPAAGWESVRHLFEVQEEARRAGFPQDKVWAIKEVRELGLELHPTNGGEMIRPIFIYIQDETARFRF
ncbi:hypothetical protein [Streptomyces sp. NBC_00358]|uniref:hypothetical protein n=1 Tax=Streptomyces sp. NBC_00358 TaxID=2975725 RepID=UPI002E253542